MTEGITQLRLDDGTVVWARITEAQELAGEPSASPYEDSSAARRVADMAGGLADVVRGVTGSLRMGLAAARPDEVTVQFGIELAAQAGRVVSLLADGTGKASLTVSLTWNERTRQTEATDRTEGVDRAEERERTGRAARTEPGPAPAPAVP
ncbi:CU044_2847 family protein [Streptomyces sp. NPDC053048]|uniref:CU044_2847 family protein n=1 Tax=Streptomyces sp. NPDC053048 TaxID=3365694 RepID=UPI0037D447E1